MMTQQIEIMKTAIHDVLHKHLTDEGIVFYVAANDNVTWSPVLMSCNAVMLEPIEATALTNSELLTEIRVILRIQGKPWQCDALVNGIYQALQPHYVTLPCLSVLLMSLHVDVIDSKPRKSCQRAVIRYIVEELRSHSEFSQFEEQAPMGYVVHS